MTTVIEPTRSAAAGPLTLAAPPRRVPRLAVYDTSSPRRLEVESFIAAAFNKHFHAHVSSFMPVLLVLHDGLGSPVAAVGCRDAASQRLFLEQYTRQPIETLLSDRLGVTVSRQHIVEIGNLACAGARAALTIVRQLILFLIHAGYRWAAFTAADTVIGVFRRLHVLPHALCRADKALLEGGHDDWGTYYEHAPTVMAGRLIDGLSAAPPLSRGHS